MLAFRRPFWTSMLADPWLNYTGPWRLFDQYFGETLDDDELAHLRTLLPSVLCNGSIAPRGTRRAGSEHGTSVVEYGNKEFRVDLDISQFKPEEVSVRLVENRLVVHGRHEGRGGQHGVIKREFTRSYVLPRDVETSKLEARLSEDGTLRISAPRQQPEKPKETTITIHQDASGSVAQASSGASAADSQSK